MFLQNRIFCELCSVMIYEKILLGRYGVMRRRVWKCIKNLESVLTGNVCQLVENTGFYHSVQRPSPAPIHEWEHQFHRPMQHPSPATPSSPDANSCVVIKGGYALLAEQAQTMKMRTFVLYMKQRRINPYILFVICHKLVYVLCLQTIDEKAMNTIFVHRMC